MKSKKLIAAMIASGSMLMASPLVTMAESMSVLPDDIYSFSIRIGETVYQLPMTYADFKESGWEPVDSSIEDEMLGTSNYTWFYMVNGDNRIIVDTINYDINSIAVKDSYVGTIELETYDFDCEATEVELPNGVFLGKATVEDITAAYGDPSDSYESDYSTSLTYERDIYEEVRLTIDKETGVLDSIEMQNFSEPEGFEVGEVSDEIPEAVLSYQAPAALTDDMSDPVVEYFGDLYQLPAPVAAFVENGWEIQDGVENDVVEGRGICFFDMMRDNQSVRFTGYNTDPNATILANTMVKHLSYAAYDSEKIAMKVSGGIELGVNIDDVVKTANDEGLFVVDERDEDNDTVRICKTEDDQYSNYLSLWVNKNEDETAVASIEVQVK